VSTDPAGDETCPEREHAVMPNAFTQPSPLAWRDDIIAPPSYTDGRKAIWISSSFGSRAYLARDALNISSANCTSNQKQAKCCGSYGIIIEII
jgi:hypothetical protein